MQFVPRFFGTVARGRLLLDNQDSFKSYLASLNGEVELVLQKYRKTRTDRQHRFYWAYLHLVAEETGHTEDDLHEFFKAKFLGSRIVMVLGETIEMRVSTTDLSKTGMAEYMDKISALTGVPIPDPTKVSVV